MHSAKHMHHQYILFQTCVHSGEAVILTIDVETGQNHILSCALRRHCVRYKGLDIPNKVLVANLLPQSISQGLV